MKPLSWRHLGLVALLAASGFAFDVAECDGDSTLGNAGILNGWPVPTANSMGAIRIDDQGSANSGLSAANVNADWAAAVAAWAGVTQTTLTFPATTSATATPAALQASLSAGDGARIWMVVQPGTQKAGPPVTTGWAAITGTDPSSFLGLTFTVFDTNTRNFLDADILLNDDPNPAGPRYYSRAATGGIPVPGRFDLRGIMIHELGHFLGADHSIQAGAAMEAAAAAGQNIDLKADDQNFLRFRYAVPAATPTNPDRNNTGLTSCTSASVQTTPPGGNSGGGGGCGAGAAGGGGWLLGWLVCLGVRRRRNPARE